MFNKFVVLKTEDVEQYCNHSEIEGLNGAIKKVRAGRKEDGRNPDAQYVVVNMDEPYIDEIIAVMKKNGHWG